MPIYCLMSAVRSNVRDLLLFSNRLLRLIDLHLSITIWSVIILLQMVNIARFSSMILTALWTTELRRSVLLHGNRAIL